MLVLTMIISSALAECPEAVSAESLSQNLDSMSVALSTRDLESLEKYFNKNNELLPCIRNLVPSETAYRYHLFNGMYHWVKSEQDLALLSFSVSKQIDSQSAISPYLFPDEHPIHEFYDGVEKADIEVVDILAEQTYYFDGRQMNVRPKGAPTIFQIAVEDDILFSASVKAGQTLPALKAEQPILQKKWLERKADAETKAKAGVKSSEKPKKHKAATANASSAEPPRVAVAPFVFLGTSGAMLGGAHFTASQFRAAPESNGMYIGNQLLFFSSIATAGTAAVLFWREIRKERGARK